MVPICWWTLNDQNLGRELEKFQVSKAHFCSPTQIMLNAKFKFKNIEVKSWKMVIFI